MDTPRPYETQEYLFLYISSLLTLGIITQGSSGNKVTCLISHKGHVFHNGLLLVLINSIHCNSLERFF